jgi:hypothetical protein
MRWSPSRLQAQERSRPNRDARGKTEDDAAWVRGAVRSRRHHLAASYCCYVNPCRVATAVTNSFVYKNLDTC